MYIVNLFNAAYNKKQNILLPIFFCPVNIFFYTLKQIVLYITESTFYLISFNSHFIHSFNKHGFTVLSSKRLISAIAGSFSKCQLYLHDIQAQTGCLMQICHICNIK